MRKNTFVGLILALAVVATPFIPSDAVRIIWTADCYLYNPLSDENYSPLEGAHQDTTRCDHGPYDLVYLVWDRDADGIDQFVTCGRELTGDTVVDSTHIGLNANCAGCFTGGFLDTTNWVVTGDYDTFYVIALNDSTLELATYYGTTKDNSPPVWAIPSSSVEETVFCNNYPWNTDTPLPGGKAVLEGSSILGGGLHPGDRKAGMERIAAVATSSEGVWTSVRIDNGPSAGCTNDSADVDSVKIYRESALPSSGFDPAEDSLIGEAEWGPGPPDGGSATVTFFNPETLTTDSSYYYVAFDIASDADWTNCVAACIQDSSYIGIPELCRNGNFPFCSEDAGLPVEISRFEGFPEDRLIVLQWTTESEIDNKGFHIYRGLSRLGGFLRVNQEIIPGAGNSYLPIDYEYTDRDLINGTEYFYKLVSVTYGNALTTYDGLVSGIPMRENRRAVGRGRLLESSPNPFARSTSIRFVVEPDGVSHVNLAVYDPSGRLVKILVDGYAESGLYTAEWDGRNQAGTPLASGLYFCQLRIGGSRFVTKLLRVK